MVINVKILLPFLFSCLFGFRCWGRKPEARVPAWVGFFHVNAR